VRAEGLAMGDASKAEALVGAAEQVRNAIYGASNQPQVAMAA